METVYSAISKEFKTELQNLIELLDNIEQNSKKVDGKKARVSYTNLKKIFSSWKQALKEREANYGK